MLHFSRRQRTALIILSGLIMTFLAFPLVWPYFQSKETYSFTEFDKALKEASIKIDKEKKEVQLVEILAPKVKIELFKFDPNTCSKEDFIRLGLSEKQSRQILNYRNKKGLFYQKADFKKIYAIDNDSYSRLEAYIEIPPREKKQEIEIEEALPNKKSIYYENKLELNNAQDKALLIADWIGEYLSVEIPNYRKQLGGFVKLEQLLEVQGMRENNYLEIIKQIRIDKSKVIKLRINFITAGELDQHPYFTKSLAKAIMIDRSQNGRFKSINDFKTRLNFEGPFIEKVIDYLEF